MKRFLMLVGVAVVAAAMYVAASPASQQAKGPTARQFNALKKQVASLSKTVKAEKTLLAACIKIAVPINQFGDGQNQTEGYHYMLAPTNPAPIHEILTTALDVTAPTDTGGVWFVGGDSTCGTALGETALPHQAAKAGARASTGLAHLFTAHRP
jgi:hypothetical protein